ncbi:hypothetical protein A5747_13195 [Mycobacterium sp. IS-836]|nr:hypothetical protein A5747_13195 [Mycobacterium sp. IS-836]
MTPHFTIRVWGSLGADHDLFHDLLGEPRGRMPVAEIEVDTTQPFNLTIDCHRGLDFIPQKMLTAAPVQPTLWHQCDE